MHSGRKTVHWDDPAPPRTGREHEHPDTSDNFGQLHRAAKGPIGADDIIAADVNSQTAWSRWRQRHVAYGGHWHDPERNGYTRVKRRFRRGTRPMTDRERAREDWTWEQLRRLRRPNGERPRTIEEMYAEAVRVGVVMIVELKARPFRMVTVIRRLIAAARRHDHPAWFMVLDDMAPRQKVAAVRQAAELEGGGQIAIIVGTDGPEKPKDWATWRYYPNRIWGPPAAQRWLV